MCAGEHTCVQIRTEVLVITTFTRRRALFSAMQLSSQTQDA
jgi:hypothetical protein